MCKDQQSQEEEDKQISACKIFLTVVLLCCVNELYRRIAARNQLSCNRSSPHSCSTDQEGVVSLTPSHLLSVAIIHFCKGLSISLPCLRKGVAQIFARRLQTSPKFRQDKNLQGYKHLILLLLSVWLQNDRAWNEASLASASFPQTY